MLRTALTGIHVLREREIVTDVTRLLGWYGLGEAAALVEEKRRGERIELPQPLRERWASRIGEVFGLLERALRESPLPEESPDAEQLEHWLVDFRLRALRRA